VLNQLSFQEISFNLERFSREDFNERLSIVCLRRGIVHCQVLSLESVHDDNLDYESDGCDGGVTLSNVFILECLFLTNKQIAQSA
jgi:hypothetical protein